MGYADQPFAQRFHKLGDQAEAAYEAALPLGKSVRFGWDRPPVTMAKMSEPIKHLPDYYAGSGYLVEVVGCGRDKTLKFRTSKLSALEVWHAIQPVYIFVYNSHLKRWALVYWDEFVGIYQQAVDKNGVKEFSSDGNTYVPIPFDWLEEKGDSGDAA